MNTTIDRAAIDAMTPEELLALWIRVAPDYRAAMARQERVFLYAIQAGEDGPIKIGLAKNPPERLKTLQCGNHADLRGLAAWPALTCEEKDIHAEFSYARLRGEWFRPVPELVELVLALGGYFCDWEDSA